jgi:predicted GTPase
MDWEQLLQEGTNYIVQNAIKQTEKDSVWGSLGKFLGLVKDKNQKILVMGCAGVGKTRFITSLYNDAHAQLAHEERTKKSKEFAVKLQGLPITIVDTAGHKTMRKERADIFVKNMLEPTLTGIINVVSYGHHEIATLKQTVENNKISTDFRNT